MPFWRNPIEGTTEIVAGVSEHRHAYIMAACASMGGMYFGWDSGLIGGILSEKAFQMSFGLDKTESALSLAALKGNIVSILQGGCFFGAASSLYLPDHLGRRNSLLFATLVFFVGSIIQATTLTGGQSQRAGLGQLYAGRFIGGFGVGLSSCVVPTYISECAPKEIRGRLAGMYQLMNVTGIMLSFWTNYGLQSNMKPETNPWIWRTAFVLQMLPGVIMVIGMTAQPESPRYLVQRGKIDQAAQSLARLRGRPVDDPTVREVLAEIIADYQGRHQLSLWQQSLASFADAKTFYRMSIAVIVMFFQQWTGTNSINIYSPEIFKSLGITGTSTGLLATGVYGVVKVVCTALGLAFAMEQAGRKVSLIVGGAIQAFSMYYIGIFQAVHTSGDVVPGSYVAIVFVYIFVIGYSFGWGSVPWAVMAECAPNHLRSLAMALGLMTNWLFNFVLAKITPTLLATIGYGTFLLFGTCSIIMILWAIFFLPETKGIALEHIHEIFEEPIMKRSLADMLPARTHLPKASQKGADDSTENGDIEAIGVYQKGHIEEVENSK